MQGRLVPPSDGRFQCFPRTNWADEFKYAAQAGIDTLEWIYDQHGADVNPIATDDGIASMLELAELHGVGLVSVCADYFMDWPLVRTSGTELEERFGSLVWLMERCKRLPIERIVIPFVDASGIDTDTDFEQVVATMGRASRRAEDLDLELHLETSLGPNRFAELLARLPSECVKVNYDIGNSASLGYAPREEFAAYGNRVGSVHLKDRVKGGGTAPLGTGDADMSAVFAAMRVIGYAGDIVLQVARGVPGDEVGWARLNREFLLDCLAGKAGRSE